MSGQGARAWHEIARETLLAAVVALVLAASGAAAQPFPSAPVRILVPFPPGGAVDIIARTLGDELGRRWSQSRLDAWRS